MWLPLIPVNQVLFVLSSRSAAEKKFRRNVIRMLDLTANSRPSRSRVSTAAAVSSSSFSLFTRLTGKKDDVGACPIVSGTFLSAFFLSNPILDFKKNLSDPLTRNARSGRRGFYYLKKTKNISSPEEEEDNDGAVWSSCIVP